MAEFASAEELRLLPQIPLIRIGVRTNCDEHFPFQTRKSTHTLNYCSTCIWLQKLRIPFSSRLTYVNLSRAAFWSWVTRHAEMLMLKCDNTVTINFPSNNRLREGSRQSISDSAGGDKRVGTRRSYCRMPFLTYPISCIDSNRERRSIFPIIVVGPPIFRQFAVAQMCSVQIAYVCLFRLKNV